MADKLEVLITGVDELTGTFQGVLKGAGIFGAALGGTITAALAGIGAFAFKTGSDLDSAFDNMIVKTGATGDELNALQDDFRNIFKDVPTDANTASDVISVLNQRLDVTGPTLEGLAEPLLEVSRLLGGDATQNAQAFTRVMGDWGVPVEEGSSALDLLFKTTQETGIGLDTLMGKVVQFGSPMRLMGFSLEETAAIFGKFEAEGVNADLVMGSLRIAAGKFAKENVPLKEGLQATFESIKNNTDASAALADGMEIFGARAGPDMVAAIREGRFAFDEMVAAISDSEGAIMDASANTMDFGEKFTILKNKAMLAFEPIGTAIFDVAGVLVEKLTPAFDAIAPVVETFAKYISIAATDGDFLNDNLSSMPTFLQPVAEAVGRVVAAFQKLTEGDVKGALSTLIPPELAEQVIAVADTIGKFITETVVPFVTEHSEAFKGALVGIAVAAAGLMIFGAIAGLIATLTNPITLVIAAIGLLGAAWATNWGGIQDKTNAVIGFLKPLIQGFLSAIQKFWEQNGAAITAYVKTFWQNVQNAFQFWTGLISGIVSTVLGAIQGFWNTHGAAIVGFAKKAWEDISGIIDRVTGVIKNVVAAFQAAFEGDWYEFGVRLRQAWDDAWELIIDVVEQIWDSVKNVLSTLINNIIGTFKNTDWGAVGTSILEGIASGITSGLKVIKDAAIAAAKAAIDAAKGFLGIKSPSTVFMEIGTQIGAGLAKGIEESAQDAHDAAVKQVQELQRKIKKAVKDGNKELAKQLRDQLKQLKEQLALELSEMGTATYLATQLVEAGSALGSIGSGIAQRVKETIIDPMKDASEVTQDVLTSAKNNLADLIFNPQKAPIVKEIEQVTAALEKARDLGGYGSEETEQYEQRLETLQQRLEDLDAERERALKSATWIPNLTLATNLTNEQRKMLEIVVNLQNKYAHETAQVRIEQEKLAQLQKAQSDLAFLKQQLDLLNLIKDNGLDASEILGGLELGINADASGLVQAMTAAMQTMIDGAQEALGVHSPSKVFQNIGANVMEGMAMGIRQAQGMAVRASESAMRAVTQVDRSRSSTYNLTINTNAQYENVLQDYNILSAWGEA